MMSIYTYDKYKMYSKPHDYYQKITSYKSQRMDGTR